jgi:Mg2+-importing ATPase
VQHSAALTSIGPSRAGLTSAEAERRLAQYGPSDPAAKKQRPRLVELLLQFANPLVLVLLFASVTSAFVNELVNATIIIVIVLLSVTLNFVQTFRSRAAAERLRERVAPTATVLRDGVFSELARALVVPGDVIRVSAGDLVPADARLLEAKDLHVQQSALTGESMPVEKEFKAGDETEATLLLLGSSVVSGTALARVLATGSRTVFGDIATRLRMRAPETEFDRGIKQFGSLIMKLVFGLVMFILVVRIAAHLFVIRTPRNPLTSRPSSPLTITTVAIVILAVILPYSPLVDVLGFEPLPARYFVFLSVATLTYLVLVQVAKRYLISGSRPYRERLPMLPA